MAFVWAESVGQAVEQSLEMLAAAIRECPAGLWETPMWPVPEPPADHPFLNADWTPVGPEKRALLANRWMERRSTPWSIAWHALETLDYDLSGEFGPWTPPPPFEGHPHWRDLPSLQQAWTEEDLLGYLAYCRDRTATTFAGMTDEMAARPLPTAHRYAGQPHARILAGMAAHTAEHAAQIRQFAAGEPPAPAI